MNPATPRTAHATRFDVGPDVSATSSHGFPNFPEELRITLGVYFSSYRSRNSVRRAARDDFFTIHEYKREIPAIVQTLADVCGVSSSLSCNISVHKTYGDVRDTHPE